MNQQVAPAKVNIFLKVTGTRGVYHTIFSRFVRVKGLEDFLCFVPKQHSGFVIEGNFDCAVEQNTIYKAYKALAEFTQNKELEQFFKSYKVVVEKAIPAFAGLGGGSSDAAAFLDMCNREFSLGLGCDELIKVGSSVGADVAFFVAKYPSANVSGIGEVVEFFDEPELELEVFTPKIAISTPKVYGCYRESFYAPLPKEEEAVLAKISSEDALKNLTPKMANDLFAPALKLYPQLHEFAQDGWFFSGSGSSFFRLRGLNG